MGTEINRVEYMKALRSSEAFNALHKTLIKVCPSEECTVTVEASESMSSYVLLVAWEFKDMHGRQANHSWSTLPGQLVGKSEGDILLFLIDHTIKMAELIAQQEKPQ